MTFKKIACIIIIICISRFIFALPAEDVEVANNSEYFPKVNELLKNAKKSIYVVMYSAYYYDNHPNSFSNMLLKDLADAKRRGVEVKVILEQEESKTGGLLGGKKIHPEQHERVLKFLKQNNVPYILDSKDVTTHSKLIIVDEIYTVVGSTNWSYSALAKNNETAVIVKSKEVALSYIDYIRKMFP